MSLMLTILLSSQLLVAQTTLRLYLVGNSVTDAINYGGLQALAQSRGNTHTWARHMIPGAPLNWLWANQNSGFTETPFGAPNNAFPNYTWDAISLQPFDRHVDGADGDKEMIRNYIDLAKGRSPNVQFYIYMRWPRTPDNKNFDDPSLTADTYTSLWQRSYTGGWDGTNETKDYFEKLLLAVRGFVSISKPVLIVPVGEVFNALNTKMKNGQVPGYNRIWQVYSDGIHMNNVGSYIAAVTYYSTLYKADPRGIGVPSQFGSIPSNVASVIQATVWEVVSSYQYSGVSSGVAVTGVSVSPTTLTLNVGQTGTLTASVSPSNATNRSVNWTSSNTTVATVDASGTITARAAGTATITATTSDGNRTASATITVSNVSGSGLSYQFYTGSWDLLPNFGSLSASKTGTVSTFDLSPRTQNDNFAFRFTGSIQIVTAGTYTFYTTSDDGSKLFINGTQVVDNDGLHGAQERSGQISLTAGTHSIEVTMFEKTGGEVLEVRYEGPSVAKQLIPASALTNTIAVSGVSVNPSTLSLMVGRNSQLSATVTPANASNKNVTWSSSNTSIATVDANGLVTAVAAGTATITVRTDNGGRTATCSLTTFNNSKPVAVLNATPQSGTAPLTVAFNTNGSSDPNAGDFILGYDWNFGVAGANSNANAPSYTFNTPGTYTVTLRVMDNNNLYSDQVTKTITVNAAGTTLRAPENPLNTTQGIDYAYYEGDWNALPNFGSLTSVKTGSSSQFDLAARNRDDLFGFRFSGFINVPTDGSYTFYTTSDDGSKLFIGNTEVVNNDGLHGAIEASGSIGLRAGRHAISVIFFEKTGGEVLEVRYDGPGISKQIIPATALFRTSVAATPTGPSGYTYCSNEGQTCSPSGAYDIAYGANGSFFYRYNVSGSLTCDNGTFGDPISGVLKACFTKTAASGYVVRETWSNVSGTTISQIPTSSAPSSTSNLTTLELPLDVADNFGTRIRGYIVPSSNGSYTFYVSGDDNVELYLSTNSDPANRTRIANIDGWTNSREWNKYPSQTSSSRSLTAGQRYFFEVLHKEGSGGDNLAIGWTGPNIGSISVIGAANIAPFSGAVSSITDAQAPSIPSGLSATNVSQTSFTLSWNASTDNVGVTSYEVFRNGTSLGSVNTTSMAVSGLSASTAYSMTVRARDAAGNVSAQSNGFSVTTSAASTGGGNTPKLRIGMNVHSTNYYTTGLIFTDVMCTASDMFTFYEGGPWNTDQINNIPRDVNGYPTQLPYNVGGNNQLVRFLINNNYSGRYVVLYDGVGQLRINGVSSTVTNGKLYIDLTGQGGHIWIDMMQSQAGNHIRNIRILPQQYENGSAYPTFLSKFVDGLRPFHALRFMDWTATNNSPQKNWSDRCTKTYYSQCTNRGMSIEYAIELANLLDAHTWFCVPHMASDDYHRNMARLIRNSLKSSLRVYIEYSNEVWNWQFSQASWVLNNAPGSVDAYVMSDLAAIDPNSGSHPEKDAYMMGRTFRLFSGEFTGTNASRLIKVAAVQHEWVDNTRRVLEFLKNRNQQCDLVSPAGYFGFGESDHNNWNARCAAVTADEVVTAVINNYDNTSGAATQQTADYARQYGVGFAVYEGGQHMQPFRQSDWCYNNAVWDAQIHPKMYDLYMKNFRKHVEPSVNCQLFMAFSYISERKSRYGSWGHLETIDQIGSVSNYMTIAPKYQALLDANLPKSAGRQESNDELAATSADDIRVFPNPTSDQINVQFESASATSAVVELRDVMGTLVLTNQIMVNAGANIITLQGASLPSGMYLVQVYVNGTRYTKKVRKD